MVLFQHWHSVSSYIWFHTNFPHDPSRLTVYYPIGIIGGLLHYAVFEYVLKLKFQAIEVEFVAVDKVVLLVFIKRALLSLVIFLALKILWNAILKLAHRSLTVFVFRQDMPEIILQRDMMEFLCCETPEQRAELQARWSQSSDRYNMLSMVDRVRKMPLQLPLQPISEEQAQTSWRYSSKSMVDVTSMSQMRTLAKVIRRNVFGEKVWLSLLFFIAIAQT